MQRKKLLMKLLRSSNWQDIPCHPVTKNLNVSGYAIVYVNGEIIKAHRYALEQKLGRPIREGYEACHHCDVKNCDEPEHLFEGTHFQNMRDAARKGKLDHGNTWGSINAAKTHCLRGHELSGDNVRTYRGSRICKACMREHQRVWKAKKRA